MRRRLFRDCYSDIVCLFIVILLLTGCSPAPMHRLAATGTVRVDGKPVQQATLVLSPRQAGVTPVTTRIEAGQFSFDQDTGPLPGEYTVLVKQDKPTIEEIIEIAEQDPRRAARTFHANADSAQIQNASVQPSVIQITGDTTPLLIELTASR